MSSSQPLTYYTLAPPEWLTPFVHYFWVLEGSASQSSPFVHRCTASTGAEWLFHYRGSFSELTGDNKKSSSFLHGVDGLSHVYTRYMAEEPFGIFGVHLYPYALQPLFGIPASAFVNHNLDVNSFAKESFNNLEEKIFSAEDNSQRVAIVSDFLISRLNKPARPEIAHIVRTILKARGDVDIKNLADQCFQSVRQFQRVFKEQTGFTPKTFAKVARFNAVLCQPRKSDESLAETAYRFGYYDQSHFIQEFKTYTGYTPKTYFSGKATELAWAG